MPTRLPTSQAPAIWIGSSLSDLKQFPDDVQHVIGYAIERAQIGGKHPSAKPLTGDRAFRGAGVLEIVDDFDGDTFRAVYTVRFPSVVYVLHVFQKKSKTGIETPKAEIERIKARLKMARKHYQETYARKKVG
jgi:phage-related protein